MESGEGSGDDRSILTRAEYTRIRSRLPLTQTRGAAQDAWNKLDFIVVFSSWINIAVELFEFDLGIGASPDPAFPLSSQGQKLTSAE